MHKTLAVGRDPMLPSCCARQGPFASRSLAAWTTLDGHRVGWSGSVTATNRRAACTALRGSVSSRLVSDRAVAGECIEACLSEVLCSPQFFLNRGHKDARQTLISPPTLVLPSVRARSPEERLNKSVLHFILSVFGGDVSTSCQRTSSPKGT